MNSLSWTVKDWLWLVALVGLTMANVLVWRRHESSIETLNWKMEVVAKLVSFHEQEIVKLKNTDAPHN